MPAKHVDHVDNDRSNEEPDNLRSLCVPCHSRKTVRCDGGFGRGRGSDSQGHLRREPFTQHGFFVCRFLNFLAGRRGPSPEPSKLSRLRGNSAVGNWRWGTMPSRNPPEGVPTLPTWFAVQLAEWKRIVPQLQNPILSVIDRRRAGQLLPPGRSSSSAPVVAKGGPRILREPVVLKQPETADGKTKTTEEVAGEKLKAHPPFASSAMRSPG